jgi:hypothetical protein
MDFREISNIMADEVRKMRDQARPTIEAVAGVMERTFARMSKQGYDIACEAAGPEAWIWIDRSIGIGLDKRIMLSGSALDECPGYPLITISQCVAPRLDSWVTFSQVVMGVDEDSLIRSISVCLTNHLAAFIGLRNAITDMIANGMDPEDVVDGLREDMEAKKITVEDLLPKKTEDLN